MVEFATRIVVALDTRPREAAVIAADKTRARARKLLAKIGGPKGAAAIQGLLESEKDDSMRRSATQAAARIGSAPKR